jgi:hypothetical protein
MSLVCKVIFVIIFFIGLMIRWILIIGNNLLFIYVCFCHPVSLGFFNDIRIPARLMMQPCHRYIPSFFTKMMASIVFPQLHPGQRTLPQFSERLFSSKDERGWIKLKGANEFQKAPSTGTMGGCRILVRGGQISDCNSLSGLNKKIII